MSNNPARPRVSVIIATHSRPHLLPRAVKSARDAGTDVEVVVVDDASTDETADVCRTLQGIKYVRADRNQRTAGARNLGILASSAPYIGFLDDDDRRLPGSIDKQVAILDSDLECGLVYGQMLLAHQGGGLLDVAPQPELCREGDVFGSMLQQCMFGCLTAVFRKDCLLRIGMLDPSIPGIDDWDLWIRIAELYPIRAVCEPVAVWTQAEPNSGQGSSDGAKLYSAAARRYRSAWLNLPRAQELLRNGALEKDLLFENAARNILHDMGVNSKNVRVRLRKSFATLRCYPPMLFRPIFYKTFLRSWLG